jgi:hypothetical protein
MLGHTFEPLKFSRAEIVVLQPEGQAMLLCRGEGRKI